MQETEENIKNYIFRYDLTKKKMGGFMPACKSIEEVQALDIASLESATVRSGWIKFTNTRNDRILNQWQQAKWVSIPSRPSCNK